MFAFTLILLFGFFGQRKNWDIFKIVFLLGSAAVSKVFDLFESEQVVENVRKVTPYLEKKLDELVEKYDCFTTRRGLGLMQGIVSTIAPGKIAKKALEHGLLVISAGSDVVRLVPPLVIEKEHVDEMIAKLEKTVEEKMVQEEKPVQ